MSRLALQLSGIPEQFMQANKVRTFDIPVRLLRLEAEVEHVGKLLV